MKVTVFRDYPEEGFHSMEVYANNLCSQLEKESKLDLNQFLPLGFISRKMGYFNLKTRFFFRFVVYPLAALFNKSDVYHIVDQTYGHLVLFLNSRKTVVTVHDLDVLRLDFLKWPTLRDKLIKWLYLFSVKSIKRSAAVIAVSEDTKNDLIKFLGIKPEKIFVIPEGVENIFKKIKENKVLEEIRKKYNLPQKFILHVGQCWEYKNIEGILNIFSQVTKDQKFKDLFFVKVGGDFTEKQNRLIENLGIKEKVIKLPFIPKEDLVVIYNLALVLTQLSFLEGFGLTVLEAMACGCPVIVSSTPALVELVGRAGMIVDLSEEKRITGLVKEIVNNRRKNLYYSSLGIKRASFYRWNKTAQETIVVYNQVLGQNV